MYSSALCWGGGKQQQQQQQQPLHSTDLEMFLGAQLFKTFSAF